MDSVDKQGGTPLLCAVAQGNARCAELLLQAGARPNVANAKHATPLSVAIRANRRDLVELLLGKGASLANVRDVKIPEWARALEQAVASGGHNHHHHYPKKKHPSGGKDDLVRALLSQPSAVVPSLSLEDKFQNTDLIQAALKGKVEPLKDLISHGVDLNARNRYGDTALHVASFNGHQGCVDILLAAKADVDALNNDNDTPLSCALRQEMHPCAESLIMSGAQLSKMKPDVKIPEWVYGPLPRPKPAPQDGSRKESPRHRSGSHKEGRTGSRKDESSGGGGGGGGGGSGSRKESGSAGGSRRNPSMDKPMRISVGTPPVDLALKEQHAQELTLLSRELAKMSTLHAKEIAQLKEEAAHNLQQVKEELARCREELAQAVKGHSHELFNVKLGHAKELDALFAEHEQELSEARRAAVEQQSQSSNTSPSPSLSDLQGELRAALAEIGTLKEENVRLRKAASNVATSNATPATTIDLASSFLTTERLVTGSIFLVLLLAFLIRNTLA